MKIIDFDRKGNLVRFYLGEDECADYWGDDWNDAPYDCNAGTVYNEFVKGVIDIVFPFNALVLEPDSMCNNAAYYSKEDMKNRIAPCIIVVPETLAADSWKYRFSDWVGADGIQKFYFGDCMPIVTEGVVNHESY
jgi:hypothetical protein